MKSINDENTYFFGVDFLRGLAALIILIWHYHHFYFTKAYFNFTGDVPKWNFEVQPFYEYLYIFYHYGYWMVQLFWVISGFVFANTYLNKEISFKKFFVNRFARLYPLHFITLIFIAVMQYLNLQYNGHYQIVGNNDLYHFILHIFFASNWGFEEPGTYSFNSVIWSVSLEVLVYGIFFLMLSFLNKSPFIITFMILLLGFILQIKLLIFQCLYYFFIGVLTFLLLQNLRKNFKIILPILVSLVSLIALSYYNINTILILFSNTFIAYKITMIKTLFLHLILSLLFMGGGYY